MAIDFLTYSPVNLLITLPAFGSAVVVSVTVVVCSGVVVGVFVYFIMIMYIYWEHPAYLFEIPYMKTLYYKIKRIMKK